MSEPHDRNRTAESPSAPTALVDAGQAAAPRSSFDVPSPVLLGEADGGRDHPVTPNSDAMPSPSKAGDRYLLSGEIARGGMGAVLRGHDVDLGRDLAVKVLLEKYANRPDAARRFIEEAQIGGQLQHPGIVPVYDIGRFGDRPFFTMKLVKGQTLAALLRGREIPVAPTPSSPKDQPRLLTIALQVAQTLAYAHAKGVIHRDLKPANIMVGAFGEVQVMDWGLAKVLAEAGVAHRQRAGRERERPEEGTVIRTARSMVSEGSGTETEAGSLLGTPAYMPPEQANGDIAKLDRRADVFGLGAMLCEILTGKPPYVGRSSEEVRRKAANGDLADAMGRLEACGADRELIDLTKTCLAPEAVDRPKDAGAVADGLAAYLEGVQQRLHATERDRAVAVTRASEERRRRKVQLALAASVLALTTLGGLGATYHFQQLQARAAAVDRVVSKAVTLYEQALAQPDDLLRWQVALAAVDQAEAGGDALAHDRLVSLRTEIQARLDGAQRDRALLDRVVDIRSAKADDEDGSVTDHDYADAFRQAGIDFATLSPTEAGERLRARSLSVAQTLAASLDDWAAIRRGKRKDAAGAARLSEAASVADPDPWRNKLRIALNQADKVVRQTELERLAKSANFEELGAIGLTLLGTGLRDAGNVALAESVLRGAQQRHAGDVWINYVLGTVLEKQSRHDEAIRFYTAARAIRPETAHELAHVLEKRGKPDEALAVFRELNRLRPGNATHLACLGQALKAKGLRREAAEKFDAATALARKAVELRPEDANAHCALGISLKSLGKLDEAFAAYRRAIQIKPDHYAAHYNLGLLFADGLKDFPAAEREFREVIELDPDSPYAHRSLGGVLKYQGKWVEAVAELRAAIRLKPDDDDYHNWLGALLCDQLKDFPAAEREFRTAIQLNPGNALAHDNLGHTLAQQDKLAEAVTEFGTAIRLDPKLVNAHIHLGKALSQQGKLDEAIAEFRAAVWLSPGSAMPHYNLGSALARSPEGDVKEAFAELREAIRLKPDYAEAHCNLGHLLKEQGDYTAALAMFRKGHELGSPRPDWQYPSARWVAEVERQLTIAKRLPALLRGEDKFADDAERLAFGHFAYDRKQFALAARFWGEALASDPKLGDDRQNQLRYTAARAAFLAGLGEGKDVPQPDETTKAKLRGQALDWLKAELLAWDESLQSGSPQAPPLVLEALNKWQGDSDLTGILDPEALANLPADERAAYVQLWISVTALVKKAAEKSRR